MKQTLLFLFLLVSASAVAQYTSIPDLNFEKTLINQGIDSGVPDGKVLTSKISTITTLNISKEIDFSNRIKDLTGIQDFIALINLNCSYNELTNIDLSKNLALNELKCFKNLLTSLNVSKNTNLALFFCNDNKLTTLDISNNTNLVYFYSEFNTLNSLDVTNNVKLMFLNAPANQLTSIDISKNINLSYFNCSYNYLTNLDLSKNINLDVLGCRHNLLTDLDLSKNKKLTYIDINNNLLTDLDLSENKKLTYIDINNNLLTNLNLKNGNNLNLGYNYSDPMRPKSDFKNNPNLICIYVDDVAYSNSNWSTLKDATANYTATENPGPKIPSPQSFCIANNQTLDDVTITSGTNLIWYNLATGGNSLLNNTFLVDGMTYYASQNSGGCESQRTPVKVFIGDSQAPIPTLANLPDINGDCKTTITTIPTATDACAGAILATTASALSYSLPGTYTVVWNYNDGNGNSVPQNQTVVISNQLLPTASSQQTFCIQENATLSSVAITGLNIKWYDAVTNGNFLPNTTLLRDGITYYASQTINGCESERVRVLINVQNTPAPTGNSAQSLCTSQNPTLNNLITGGTAIKWYDSLIAGAILPDNTLLQDGKTYYATQTLYNCESQTRFAVTVAFISTLPANNYEEEFCDDLDDATETVDLSSYNSKVISSTSGYFFTYYNSISGAEKETAGDKIINFSSYKLALGDNKIYVRINSNTPCYAVAEVKLTLFSKPIINIQDIVPICEDKTITIDAGAGFDDYLWSNGAKTQTISVVAPGNFSVTVTDDYNTISCSSTKNFEVKRSNKATINTIESKDWTDNNNVITVIATGDGEYEYSIDGINYQTNNQFTGLFSGKYNILVRDKNGCGTATNEVYLLMFLKFFTPNGDGYNDTWKIKFSDNEAGLTIKIFDRYGKLIKNLITNTDSWDGTFNGNNLPADDYWFIVTRVGGQEYKGHFSLKR